MNKEIDYLKEHLYEIYKYKKSMKDLTYDMDIEHLLRTCKALDYSQKEIERLNNKYNKALELLADYNLPCEYDEGKIPDNYCEENCSEDYKKCWNKYIELELKGDSSNE